MSRQTEYIDEQGRTWLTPAKVAEIWIERAEKEHHSTVKYSRWSVYQRRNSFAEHERLSTPGGELYLEEAVRQIKLRPHPMKRPDVTARRKKKDENEILESSEKSSENA